ncbi:DUF7793 family protein [Acidiluteibacter ferrifornacis]|uniref:DUF7793 domain-containing protein n=1 Tax=Acidiluteibacter ferrifornacis TaxID=2692424 RepID=A0A6N9NMU4_9FLAO|nr:hypothetical protein [Acidiluteibacter ferrifornacis]NBG67214.1 hypothetical protein [Acidiluteibacter ferrifornacis]
MKNEIIDKYSIDSSILVKDIGIAKFYFNKELNILEIEYQANVNIGKEEVMEVLLTRAEIVKGSRVLVLVSITKEFINFTDEARSTFVNEQKKDATAFKMALLIKGLADKIVANFFIRYNKPIVPTKIFSKREKAIAWLLEEQ